MVTRDRSGGKSLSGALRARMGGRIDVLGLGAVAVDELLFVDEYPTPDTKCVVARRERHLGGLAAIALLSAAKMGCGAAYAGVLGDDEHSLFARDVLEHEGVSTEWLVRREGAKPFRSTIIVDTTARSRTILFDSEGVIGADANLPEDWVIASSRVLLVDHVGLPGMVRAARIARSAGVPVVADFERRCEQPFDELLALTDHLIVPSEFAKEMTGASDESTAVKRLWSKDRSAVVVTKGAEGAWYLSRQMPERVRHQTAVQVEVVDTTGCGDVFHGVYAATLCWGMSMQDRMLWSAAAAAARAARGGGPSELPTRAEVAALITTSAKESNNG